MIVYGDHPETVRSADHLELLARLRLLVLAHPAGIARHAALATLFIEVGRTIQGIADGRFKASGEDGSDDDVERLTAHAVVLGRLLIESWESEGAGCGTVPPLPYLDDMPETMTLKQPEGYAFYALYPDSYAAAARRLELRGPARVIGVRSIGTGLSALVAAALDAPLPVTVRPVGHPFQRRLALSSTALAALIVPGAHHVVVDEGPGLSGSSFAAVANCLEDHGVPRTHIAFLPSHDGAPGGEASDSVRTLWRGVQRATVLFEALVPLERLARWVETLTGPLDAPLEDVSGGGWRRVVERGDWPVDPVREPLKYLGRAGGRRWLVKFAGIGSVGDRKLERARCLASAGLIPKPAGMVYGFLVQEWVEAETGATPSLAQVAHYLSQRRDVLAVPRQQGASLDALAEMAAINIAEALGEVAGARCRLGLDARGLRGDAMAIDGRMDRAKWLGLADGAVLKADALDHDGDHDLIGPQDIAWDVVGATVELGLDKAALVAALGEKGVVVESRLLQFLKRCYLAYRIGRAHRAAYSAGSPGDYAVQIEELARYSGLLSAVLALEDDGCKRSPQSWAKGAA